MRALILAAGRGRRMKNLTDERPKALLPVDGKPLIEWTMSALREARVSEIAIVTGYRRELLEAVGADRYFHNPEWESSNMVRSLFAAAEWLKESDTLLCYSDILFTSNTVRQLASSPGDIVIANNVNWYTTWSKRFSNPLEDAETFKRTEEGRLTEIGLKPQQLSDIEGQYMGLIKITAPGWARFERLKGRMTPEEFRKIDMTSTLNRLIQEGEKLDTVDIEEDWFEFDSEEDLNAYV